MTCVVALKHEGKIYMGADSAGVGGYSLQIRNDPKIYRVRDALFGFTTSFRMGQLLGHAFAMPLRDPEIPIAKFMVTSFIDAVRNCLKNGGYAKKENEVERGGTFLVAYAGEIFEISDDYQVGKAQVPYAAVGCGFDLALGSLYTTSEEARNSLNLSPDLLTPAWRIHLALQAAENFSAGVRRPFLIEELKP